jgi:hypothetical protein
MNRFRHLGTALWLALALLLGQAAAAMHELGHATARLSQQESTPAPSSCDLCCACAQLGGIAGTAFPTLPLVQTVEALPTCISASVAPAATHFAFLSRAPPTLL